MTAFEFMTNALYLMVGVVCGAVTLMVVFGVIAGIRKSLSRHDKKDKKDQ